MKEEESPRFGDTGHGLMVVEELIEGAQSRGDGVRIGIGFGGVEGERGGRL